MPKAAKSVRMVISFWLRVWLPGNFMSHTTAWHWKVTKKELFNSEQTDLPSQKATLHEIKFGFHSVIIAVQGLLDLYWNSLAHKVPFIKKLKSLSYKVFYYAICTKGTHQRFHKLVELYFLNIQWIYLQVMVCSGFNYSWTQLA